MSVKLKDYSSLINDSECYWLLNCHSPKSLLPPKNWQQITRNGLCVVDLQIQQGKISQIVDAGKSNSEQTKQLDLQKKIVLPCFSDLHTHLDKGHIWERSPNLDGTFQTALNTAIADSQQFWQAEDVYRRMDFSLKCAYAYGTKAIRTHLDSFGGQAAISWQVFHDLRHKWQDKLVLQAVSLVSLDYYQTPEGVALANLVQGYGGILGGVLYINPELDGQIETLFKLAAERNLDLDLHVDENGDPNSICLAKVAEAAIKYQFSGKIVCGHCCSLAVQSPIEMARTVELVKQAGITVVSLPMCNLYLQDRQYNDSQYAKTPIWRGVTRVHELQQNDVPVAFASDNTRDPFYSFGDLDMWEVFQQATRIAHLDCDYDYWVKSITQTPTQVMGLETYGFSLGTTADLVIFPSRYYSELLSRSQYQRVIIRDGQIINSILPEYTELDDLVGLI